MLKYIQTDNNDVDAAVRQILSNGPFNPDHTPSFEWNHLYGDIVSVAVCVGQIQALLTAIDRVYSIAYEIEASGGDDDDDDGDSAVPMSYDDAVRLDKATTRAMAGGNDGDDDNDDEDEDDDDASLMDDEANDRDAESNIARLGPVAGTPVIIRMALARLKKSSNTAEHISLDLDDDSNTHDLFCSTVQPIAPMMVLLMAAVPHWEDLQQALGNAYGALRCLIVDAPQGTGKTLMMTIYGIITSHVAYCTAGLQLPPCSIYMPNDIARSNYDTIDALVRHYADACSSEGGVHGKFVRSRSDRLVCIAADELPKGRCAMSACIVDPEQVVRVAVRDMPLVCVLSTKARIATVPFLQLTSNNRVCMKQMLAEMDDNRPSLSSADDIVGDSDSGSDDDDGADATDDTWDSMYEEISTRSDRIVDRLMLNTSCSTDIACLWLNPSVVRTVSRALADGDVACILGDSRGLDADRDTTYWAIVAVLVAHQIIGMQHKAAIQEAVARYNEYNDLPPDNVPTRRSMPPFLKPKHPMAQLSNAIRGLLKSPYRSTLWGMMPYAVVALDEAASIRCPVDSTQTQWGSMTARATSRATCHRRDLHMMLLSCIRCSYAPPSIVAASAMFKCTPHVLRFFRRVLGQDDADSAKPAAGAPSAYEEMNGVESTNSVDCVSSACGEMGGVDSGELADGGPSAFEGMDDDDDSCDEFDDAPGSVVVLGDDMHQRLSGVCCMRYGIPSRLLYTGRCRGMYPPLIQSITPTELSDSRQSISPPDIIARVVLIKSGAPNLNSKLGSVDDYPEQDSDASWDVNLIRLDRLLRHPSWGFVGINGVQTLLTPSALSAYLQLVEDTPAVQALLDQYPGEAETVHRLANAFQPSTSMMLLAVMRSLLGMPSAEGDAVDYIEFVNHADGIVSPAALDAPTVVVVFESRTVVANTLKCLGYDGLEKGAENPVDIHDLCALDDSADVVGKCNGIIKASVDHGRTIIIVPYGPMSSGVTIEGCRRVVFVCPPACYPNLSPAKFAQLVGRFTRPQQRPCAPLRFTIVSCKCTSDEGVSYSGGTGPSPFRGEYCDVSPMSALIEDMTKWDSPTMKEHAFMDRINDVAQCLERISSRRRTRATTNDCPTMELTYNDMIYAFDARENRVPAPDPKPTSASKSRASRKRKKSPSGTTTDPGPKDRGRDIRRVVTEIKCKLLKIGRSLNMLRNTRASRSTRKRKSKADVLSTNVSRKRPRQTRDSAASGGKSARRVRMDVSGDDANSSDDLDIEQMIAELPARPRRRRTRPKKK